MDILRLIRLQNCLLAMVGVAVGARLTTFDPVYFGPLVTALAAFLVCAGGNCHNDLKDIACDRINHPDRMLVTGAVSPETARILIIVSYGAALLLAWSVNTYVVSVVAAAIVLLSIYNLWAKRLPLLGNVIISSLAGLLFLAGGWAADPQLVFVLPGPLIPAVFAFFFHLVREIIKDVEDIEGDSAAAVRTLPMKIGSQPSLLLALGLFVAMAILTYIPVYEGWFNARYKLIAVYLVDFPLIVLLIFAWGFPTQFMLRLTSRMLKLGMALGLIAILVG